MPSCSSLLCLTDKVHQHIGISLHIFLQRGIQWHTARVPCQGTFPPHLQCCRPDSNHWLTACKIWSMTIPSPSLTHWHVLQRLLPSIVQNHSAKGYVYCTAGTICIQPLKLPFFPLAWGRKQGITVLGEQRLRVSYEPQGSQGAKLTTLAKWQ